MLSGNTADSTTLSAFLRRIEQRYGRANRIWVMDRGVPTEDSLAEMRAQGASYLVGTPGGRLTKLEQAFLGQPWVRVREGVQVKPLATEQDVYVLAQSDARIDKERGMRRKQLRRYVDRLRELQSQTLTRDQLPMKLGAAQRAAGACYAAGTGDDLGRQCARAHAHAEGRSGHAEGTCQIPKTRPARTKAGVAKEGKKTNRAVALHQTRGRASNAAAATAAELAEAAAAQDCGLANSPTCPSRGRRVVKTFGRVPSQIKHLAAVSGAS